MAHKGAFPTPLAGTRSLPRRRSAGAEAGVTADKGGAPFTPRAVRDTRRAAPATLSKAVR